jgi:hypothetical protein
MSRKLRAGFIGAFSLLAFTALASNASALTLTTGTGNYVASTTSNQTLSAPTIFGTLTISCSQSATLNAPSAGPIGVGRTLGSLTGITFSCLNGASATVLNLPRPITLTSESATTALATIQDVQVSVTTFLGTCLFRGPIGFSVTINTTVGALLGATLTYVSGPCSGNGTVSRAAYAINRTIGWRIP